MATYRTSPEGLVASGSVGGVVFRPLETQGVLSTKRARLRGDDRLVGLDLQAHKAASEAWSDADDAYREAWDEMALNYQTANGFSEPSNQTGHSLFLRTARSLLAAGGPFPPPTPVLQVNGRRQSIPFLFPDPSSSSWAIRWAGGLIPGGFPGTVFLRARATPVSRPSVRRPSRSYSRTFQIPSGDVPISPFDPAGTLSGFEFERDRGWVRWEFVTWDQFGWFSSARSIIYPVLPSSATWFLATGPDRSGEPNGIVEYHPPDIRVAWRNSQVDFERTETIGPGGLVTVGDVAEWVDGDTFLRVMPFSAEDETGDATELRPIPGASVNIRGDPVVFDFGTA